MSLNKEELTMILKIIDMSLEFGVPMVENAIENINKEVITQEDIDNLSIDEDWDDYFEKD